MGPVTQAQAELLKWVVESGTGEVLHVPVGNAAEDIVIIPGGPRRMVNPSDFRELIAQGLVRHVKDQMHELTNEGRLAYEELSAPPPPEKPPVGFQP